MQDHKKETNATKKYYLLQHQIKATTTNRTKRNARKQHQKKD